MATPLTVLMQSDCENLRRSMSVLYVYSQSFFQFEKCIALDFQCQDDVSIGLFHMKVSLDLRSIFSWLRGVSPSWLSN